MKDYGSIHFQLLLIELKLDGIGIETHLALNPNNNLKVTEGARACLSLHDEK